jgi:hypothetical protein
MKGKLMYGREDVRLFIKMLEQGLVNCKGKGEGLMETKCFKLEEWEEAFEVAGRHAGIGSSVVLMP